MTWWREWHPEGEEAWNGDDRDVKCGGCGEVKKRSAQEEGRDDRMFMLWLVRQQNGGWEFEV